MLFKPQPGTRYVRFEILDNNGKQIPYIIPSTAKAKRCRGLAMIMRELESVEVFINRILQDPNHANVELLWHSAIIAYGRCFATAEGRGTKLETCHIRDIGSDSEAIHKEVIELRNQYIAHSGQNEQQRFYLVVTLDGSIDDPKIGQVLYQEITEIMPGIDHLKAFHNLVSKLIPVVNELIDKAEQLLISECNDLPVSMLKQNAMI